jgi:hypothetical protein
MSRKPRVADFEEWRASLHGAARHARERALDLAKRALVAQQTAADVVETTESRLAESRLLRSEMRETIAIHARAMRGLGVPREQTMAIVTELADRATRDVVTTSGHGVWPEGTNLRADFAEWTREVYCAV